MKKYYFYYFIFTVVSALIISMALILENVAHTLEIEKGKLTSESQKLEEYIQEAKKLENILEKVKLKTYKKDEANTILLKFLENLRKDYKLEIKSISDKEGIFEVEAQININIPKNKLRKLLFFLTKSTSPVVYIERFTLTETEKSLEIKIYQPYLTWGYNDTKIYLRV